jgi:putative permease
MQIVTDWFRRFFADPQLVFLTLSLVAVFAVVLTMGDMLGPVLASIVIAYLLEGIVARLQRWGMPRLPAVALVFASFVIFVVLLLFGVLPLASRQVTELMLKLPDMITQGTQALTDLPSRHPDLVTQEQIAELIDSIRAGTLAFVQRALSWSLAGVVGLMTVAVYLILMPLLVFFFLKDKDLILAWFREYLPAHRGIAGTVWREVDRQISNYVRGKFWQILILWSAAYATFLVLKLNYAMLLALLVGVAVIVPFVGATLAAVPVLLVGWFEWGWSSQLLWLTLAFMTIQAVDGNVVVPLLFSEVVDLHPVAIIVAILVFGGLWGFWGVFFAIPLATLVQAILTAWPRQGEPGPQTVG